MPVRKASAEWLGTLREGNGTFSLGSVPASHAYTFGTRFEEAPGTNPEELIGAALASCYSMAFSADLGRAGFTPDWVRTSTQVHFNRTDAGFRINRIDLDMEAKVPGIDAAKFQEVAEGSKKGCPISNALAAIPEITLNARLVS